MLDPRDEKELVGAIIRGGCLISLVMNLVLPFLLIGLAAVMLSGANFPHLDLVFSVLLAFFAASLAAFLPGKLHIKLPPGITASGALAAFVIVLMLSVKVLRDTVL